MASSSRGRGPGAQVPSTVTGGPLPTPVVPVCVKEAARPRLPRAGALSGRMGSSVPRACLLSLPHPFCRRPGCWDERDANPSPPGSPGTWEPSCRRRKPQAQLGGEDPSQEHGLAACPWTSRRLLPGVWKGSAAPPHSPLSCFPPEGGPHVCPPEASLSSQPSPLEGPTEAHGYPGTASHPSFLPSMAQLCFLSKESLYPQRLSQ